MSYSHHPKRLRRLDRVFDSSPAYFLTLCTNNRTHVLNAPGPFDRMRCFAAGSMKRYGIFVDAYVLMPDHMHLIATLAPDTETTIGQWIKALKAFVSNREFRWQPGFFDHILRSDESRSEKWDYIRQNPVRAGLVQDSDEWPYQERFNPFDGSTL